MNSIQARLNTGFILISVVAIIVLWLANSWFLRQTAYEFVSTRLSSDAYALLRAVNRDENGGWKIDADRVDPVYQQPMSGHYYQVGVNNVWIYSRSLWDEVIPTMGGERIGDEQVHLVVKGGKPWLVLDQSFMKEGAKIQLVLAEDVQRIDQALKRLGWGVAVAGGVFLVVMLLLQMTIIRRGLKVLSRVRDDITRLKQGEVRQLPAANTTEVDPLVTEINYLVQAMELRLERSRKAVGNLAHAAKTPLTVLDRQIERIRTDSPATATGLAEQSTRLREIMERELTRARIAGAALPGQRIYLRPELDKLQRTLQAIYRDRALQLRVEATDSHYFPGERDDLMELLGNLMDNACKWASTQVSVSVDADPHCLTLSIEDDGPGIDTTQRERLVSRGERLDESTDGYGLGMSIVTDIVKQYDGHFSLDRSERFGGLKAVVMLPLYSGAMAGIEQNG